MVDVFFDWNLNFTTSFFSPALSSPLSPYQHSPEHQFTHPSSSSTPNAIVTTPLESSLVGVFFLLLTTSFALPYLYALCFMIRDKNLSRKSFQRIMIALGYVDLLQLAVNGYVGSAFVIARCNPPFWINKFLGGLLNTSFIVHSSLVTLLAFNRFVVMCMRQEYRQSIFSRSKTDWMIAFCYLYGAGYLVAHLCPQIDVLLQYDLYSWHYSSTPESSTFSLIELVQDFSQIAIMIMCYACVVVKMKMLVANMSTAAFVVGNRGQTVANREIGVSIQAALVSTVVIVGLIVWFTAPQLAANRWSYMSANALWLATAGTQAWIYFLFNKRLRIHAFYYACPLWKSNRRRRGVPLDAVDESAVSSSNYAAAHQKNKRTIALMGYGAACMVGRPPGSVQKEQQQQEQEQQEIDTEA